MSEQEALFQTINLEKDDNAQLPCTLGTVGKPQPAVILVLDHSVLEDNIAQFVSYLGTLRISAFVERSTDHELVFVCLYLTRDACEDMAQRLSYHVPFYTYRSKNPPDSWTTKLFSVITYGTLSYRNFTEIDYSVMFHKRLKQKLEPEKMSHLHSVRVQSEMIYHILQREEVFRENGIKITGHFVPHTPEALELWNKVSWFPPFFPLKEFRDYFGEELAFTYAWSNFWWTFGLVPISIFALLCLILGLTSQDFGEFDKTIAEPTWPYFARVMVNSSTNYYICFVMIWIAVFQNQWSCAAPILSIQWGVSNYHQEEPRHRSSKQVKYRRLIALPNLVISVIGFLVAAASTAVLFLVVEIILRAQLKDKLHISYVNGICPFIYTTLNMITGSFFIPWLSRFLTDMENHKFQSFYSNSVIFKYTGYYLMTSYCYLIFLSLDIHRYIFVHYEIELREPNIDAQQFEVIELTQQLIFLIVGLRLKGIAKSFLSWCVRKFQKRKIDVTAVTDESDLSYILDNYRAFKLLDTSECSMWMGERIIMYGYLTMFSYHVPIVAFLALVLELLVSRFEIHVLLRMSQRPQPRRVGSIKQWQGLIYLINVMSVIINAYSIHLRSEDVNPGSTDCLIKREHGFVGMAQHDKPCVFEWGMMPLLFMPVFLGYLSLIQIQSSFSGDKYQMHISNQYQMAVQFFADDFINTDSGPSSSEKI